MASSDFFWRLLGRQTPAERLRRLRRDIALEKFPKSFAILPRQVLRTVRTATWTQLR